MKESMKVLLVNQIPEVNNKYTFSLARALMEKGVTIAVCGIADDNISLYKEVAYIDCFENYSKIKKEAKSNQLLE